MFKGSFVALVTPMLPNGDIDYPALDKLVDFHLENRTDGFVLLGTTGESPTVSESEHAQIIKHVVKRVNKKIPLIAGVGKNDTRATIHLAQEAVKLGVDGLLIVTPYYNRPTQEGLFLHYKAISEAVHVPQLVYNVPRRTGCDLLPETMARLAKLPNIVGIKETISVERVGELIQHCGQIPIYCGDDENNLPMLKAGACGLISVTANVAPRPLHDMCEAFYKGDVASAEKIHARLALLNKNLFLETNPIAVKWAMSQMGLLNNVLRLPLTPLNKKYYADVKAAMELI
jgi:4-hydroxy-tetrahydrodipicolinate synthase